MDILQGMESRRSCRDFAPDPVPEELLNKVLRAGTFAATGMNRQSPVMIAVTNRPLRDKLSKLNGEIMGTDRDPFYGAPVIIIVLADRRVPTYIYDGSLVMGNLMLAAHACGLAGCWIHRAKEEFNRPEGQAILRELGITGDYEGIGHCALGYAASLLKAASPRKENYIYTVK